MDLNQEKDTIRRAKNDPQAFGLIFDEYYSKILRYAVKRTASIQAAEDIAAETFYKAYGNLWRFRWQNLSISSWLYRIATHEIANYFRKGKTVSLDELMEASGVDLPSSIDVQGEILDAEEMLERHKEFLRIQKALAAMPAKYQEVIALRFFEDKKIGEIAEILGKREGTVKSLLSRGIEQLRNSLSEEKKITTQPFLDPDVVMGEGRENN